MKVVKTVQTLANPKNPDWEALVLETLGTDIHPTRALGFLLARVALQQAFLNFGLTLAPLSLRLENYSKVSSQPSFTLSLSHTKDMGAAVVAETQNYKSLGIDIEPESREVKDSIVERIAHPQDVSLRKIELWCLKEAAFKALMNTQNFSLPIEFSSIEIQEKKFAHSPSGISGEWEIHFENGYVIAIASVRA